MKRIFAICLLLLSQAIAASAHRGGPPYPPNMKSARVETYKTVGNTKLKLYIFAPAAVANAPAIVFFFGGGWSNGSPQAFEDQCRYLAGRGMMAITADYRVRTRQNAKPVQCVEDARSAIRWVRPTPSATKRSSNASLSDGGVRRTI